VDLGIHYGIGMPPPTSLGQTMVTDDTSDTTFRKLLRKGDIGDFPKSASPSLIFPLTYPSVSHVRLRQWPQASSMFAIIGTFLTLGFAGPTSLPWLEDQLIRVWGECMSHPEHLSTESQLL